MTSITKVIALIAFALCATVAIAQPGATTHTRSASPVYLRIGAGYGFAHAGRTEINGAHISGSETSAGSTYSLAVKRASFGSGACANVAGGYMITPYIGLELGVHAIIAPKQYSFSGILSGSGGRTYTSTAYARQPVYFIPAIVLSTGNKLQMYARAGLVLPVSDKLINKETRSGAGIGQTEEVFNTEVKLRFSIGFQGAVGLTYVLNSHFSLWGEANAISRNAYARQSVLTSYTEDGIDRLGTYTTYQKVTDYEFSYDATYPAQVSLPEKQATFSVPFSSIGLSLGVKYAL